MIDCGQDPFDRAISRILETSLDRRDHRLGYSGAVRKVPLGQTLSAARGADGSAGRTFVDATVPFALRRMVIRSFGGAS